MNDEDDEFRDLWDRAAATGLPMPNATQDDPFEPSRYGLDPVIEADKQAGILYPTWEPTDIKPLPKMWLDDESKVQRRAWTDEENEAYRSERRAESLRSSGLLEQGSPKESVKLLPSADDKTRQSEPTSVSAAPSSLGFSQCLPPPPLSAPTKATPNRSDPLFPGAPRLGNLNRHMAPGQNYQVDWAKSMMNRHNQQFAGHGDLTAADHLRHYVEGSGKAMTYQRDRARSFPMLRGAEDEIRGNYENKTFLGIATGQNKEAEKLRTLKDGETTTLKGVPQVGMPQFAKEYLLGDSNAALAFGRTAIKSGGTFTATRNGDTINITGVVGHGWGDRYDFHEGQPGNAEGTTLEKAGIAKPFDFGGFWEQSVTGTVRVENGKLVDPQFTWKDLEPGWKAPQE